MTAKIAKALHEVMSKVGYVQKTGKNAFHGYKYAGEADLLKQLRPAMLDAGLLLIPSVNHIGTVDEHGNVSVSVEYTLMHKDGDVWPEKIIAAGCGNDRSKNGSVGDKGIYKAITGANKYLLFKLFQIETGDDPESHHDDEEDRVGRPANAAPAAPPKPVSLQRQQTPPTKVVSGPQLSPADQEAQESYVGLALAVMENTTRTEAEWKKWWQDEAAHRAEHKLLPDQGPGKELVEAYKNTLAKARAELLMAG